MERRPEGFRLVTSHRELAASKIIVTVGGQSYPGSGTTGDGYTWAAALGHTIVPAAPRARAAYDERNLGPRTERHHDSRCVGAALCR